MKNSDSARPTGAGSNQIRFGIQLVAVLAVALLVGTAFKFIQKKPTDSTAVAAANPAASEQPTELEHSRTTPPETLVRPRAAVRPAVARAAVAVADPGEARDDAASSLWSAGAPPPQDRKTIWRAALDVECGEFSPLSAGDLSPSARNDGLGDFASR